MLSDYESDLAAQTTLRDKLHVAKIYGGMPWVMAAIHVAGVGKLSSMSPEQAARVFAIPLRRQRLMFLSPPSSCTTGENTCIATGRRRLRCSAVMKESVGCVV